MKTISIEPEPMVASYKQQVTVYPISGGTLAKRVWGLREFYQSKIRPPLSRIGIHLCS